MKILIDTSFLLKCVQKGGDLFYKLEETLKVPIEPIILENVLKELKNISSIKGKKSKEAKLALEIANKYNKIAYNENIPTDEALLEIAFKNKYPVLTCDIKLKKKLREKKIPVIFLKKDGKIDVEGILE
ncbi:MAG: nucleotide-binding protein [Nitrososphaerota archaeon]